MSNHRFFENDGDFLQSTRIQTKKLAWIKSLVRKRDNFVQRPKKHSCTEVHSAFLGLAPYSHIFAPATLMHEKANFK